MTILSPKRRQSLGTINFFQEVIAVISLSLLTQPQRDRPIDGQEAVNYIFYAGTGAMMEHTHFVA
jgi:hypothetical protein